MESMQANTEMTKVSRCSGSSRGPSFARRDRQRTSPGRNDFQARKRTSFDNLHVAQPTNEEGIISLAKVRMKKIVLAAQTTCFCKLSEFQDDGDGGGGGGGSPGLSYVRRKKQRTIINLQSRGKITRQSVPGQKKVVVRPRTSMVQTNGTDHSSQVRMEGDEEIDEEEAVCKFCFDILKEENILKTECGCKNALVHEECAANQTRVRGNNTCDYCGQEISSFPVTLLRGLGSAQRMDTQESKKKSWISRLIRKSK